MDETHIDTYVLLQSIGLYFPIISLHRVWLKYKSSARWLRTYLPRLYLLTQVVPNSSIDRNSDCYPANDQSEGTESATHGYRLRSSKRRPGGHRTSNCRLN